MNPQTQTTPTTQYNMAAVPQNLQDLAGKTTGFLSSQIGQNAPAYPYAMSAPMSSGQLAQAGLAGALAGPEASTAAPTAGAINAIMGGAYMPQNDPYLQGVMGGYGAQEAQDIQALHSTYGASPGVNTGIADLEGRLRQGYAGQAANLLENARQQAIGQQLSAMPYGLQGPQQAVSNLGTVGGTQQQTMQNYLNAAYQDYLRQIQQPWTAATAAQPYVERAYTPQGVETTTTPSLFSQLLSTGAAAAPFFIK